MSSLTQQVRAEKSALTVEHISRLLTLSKIQIYKMVAAGRIPFIRIGGRIRFDPGDLAEWIERQTVEVR